MNKSVSLNADAQGFTYTANHVCHAADARASFAEYVEQYADAGSDVFGAEVIFGELLANVSRHAPGPIAIHVHWQGTAAILEIWDEGPGYVPSVPTAGPPTESKRGLALVAALGRQVLVRRYGSQTVTSVYLPIRSYARSFLGGSAPHANAGIALRDERNRSITLLQAMMSLHFPAVVAHMEAVAALAEKTARAMALDEATIERCRLAARIHDIGLNAVEKDVILTGSKLEAPARASIAQHSRHAEAVARATPILADLAPIVRAHHEQIDGSGYPDGLTGNAIPIESRVISVADAFHAMTMASSYRSIAAPDSAMRELFENSGGQFDADVVSAFAEMLGYTGSRDAASA